MKLSCFIVAALLGASELGRGDVSIKDVLQEINSGTGKAKEFTISGVVAGRITLPNDRVVAYVLNAGEPALAVSTDLKDGVDLIPRNEVTITGTPSETVLGSALLLKAGSVSVTGTNKPFGTSEVRGGVFFRDASSLAGRYVQLTNITLTPGKFGADGLVKAKSTDGTETTIMVGKGAFGREVPAEAVNVFGIPVKVGDEWRLMAARFLLVRAKEVQNIASKRTCFTCHNPDTKLLGPPYREVAAKYRNDSEAIVKLTAQMEKGGSGKWGPLAMPPLGALVPPEERKSLAEWIMSYRWDAVLAE